MKTETGVARLGDFDRSGDGDLGSAGRKREITVIDSHGEVVYRAQMADTPRAADAHIRAAGYDRAGDWIDDECIVHRLPARVRRRKILLTLTAVVTFFALVGGCNTMLGQNRSTSISPRATSAASTPGTAGTYMQTWTKSYSSTTCADWSKRMSEGQRLAAAADTLTAARKRTDAREALPSDALIREFRASITIACIAPSMTLSQVSEGLYKTESRFHP